MSLVENGKVRALGARLLVCVCLATTLLACSDDDGSKVTPTEKKDMAMSEDLGAEDAGQDMPIEEDMGVDEGMPDLGMEEMGGEVDMEVDPAISGMWELKLYQDDMPTGDAIVSFDLMNAMGSTEVIGSFMQGDASGSATGSLVSNTLNLEWTVESSAQTYQFVNGSLSGSMVLGNFNDPELGGIPQPAVLVRP